MAHILDHFSKIASKYRDLRTTDVEPVAFIRDQVRELPFIHAADVGCGAGRYDALLVETLGRRLRLDCIDPSPEMLGELATLLEDCEGVRAVMGSADALPLGNSTLDCVLTFNAVQHFDLPEFLKECQRVLKPGGRAFIYTRLQAQNAQSVWGRHFPGFARKETRLYNRHDFIRAAAQTPGLQIGDFVPFEFPRCSTAERLMEQAQHQHYSTFYLYDEAEFQWSLAQFEHALQVSYQDPNDIRWVDQNTFVVMHKPSAGRWRTSADIDRPIS